ncbi:helix-turn-helix domain-containing protein [Paraburkholderia sediminicola]|uniref:helix-turn-helix domain-containing protein n=1 Tax=Paraburkholderia sediminicola TaxID=458836 RepID=UPI0038BB27EF
MNESENLVTTENISPGARLGFWTRQVSSLMTNLECSSVVGDRFHGSIKIRSMSATSMFLLSTAAHNVARATPRYGGMGDETVFVCVQGSGTAVVEQDCRQAVLRPGDITLLDTSQCFSADFPGDMEQLVLLVPRKQLRQRVGMVERLTATVLSGDSPLGAITGDFLRSFARDVGRLRAPVAVRLEEQAIDMISMAFTSTMDEIEPRASATRSALAYRGRAYIESNLRSPNLSPTDVAEQLGISRRYLSTVFSCDGLPVERFIRERRLEKCARDLADRGLISRSIGDIAFSWGFNNLTHFSQAFKTMFGLSPREYRKQMLVDVEIPSATTRSMC